MPGHMMLKIAAIASRGFLRRLKPPSSSEPFVQSQRLHAFGFSSGASQSGQRPKLARVPTVVAVVVEVVVESFASVFAMAGLLQTKSNSSFRFEQKNS